MDTADGENVKAPGRDRSKRIYVLWGVGFAVLAALGAVCWLVVGPVMEVGRVIGFSHTPPSCLVTEGGPLVAQLGGQERASRKLALYLRVYPLARRWRGSSGEDESAAVLLGHCSKWGLARIVPMLESEDPEVQTRGYYGMCGFFQRTDLTREDARDIWRGKALRDLDSETRELAIKALAGLDSILPWKESPPELRL